VHPNQKAKGGIERATVIHPPNAFRFPGIADMAGLVARSPLSRLTHLEHSTFPAK
jgi:hypothetical protein